MGIKVDAKNGEGLERRSTERVHSKEKKTESAMKFSGIPQEWS